MLGQAWAPREGPVYNWFFGMVHLLYMWTITVVGVPFMMASAPSLSRATGVPMSLLPLPTTFGQRPLFWLATDFDWAGPGQLIQFRGGLEFFFS